MPTHRHIWPTGVAALLAAALAMVSAPAAGADPEPPPPVDAPRPEVPLRQETALRQEATLRMQVVLAPPAAEAAVDAAEGLGGYAEPQRGAGTASLVVLHVPSGRLEPLLDKVKGLGVELELNRRSVDVAPQLELTRRKIEHLEGEILRLRALLADSEEVGGGLAVLRQLEAARQQLAGHRRRLARQQEDVETSTLHVYLLNARQARSYRDVKPPLFPWLGTYRLENVVR